MTSSQREKCPNSILVPVWNFLSFFVLTFLISLLTSYSVIAQDSHPEADVDSIFTSMNRPTEPGCALSVMRDGAPIYEQGYGMANLEYGIPITPNSVFHVASVSKHFTAMAIELLVNEGRVSWDDNIRDYVPEVPDFDSEITLRHLVHHVSGIRDQWSLLSMAGWRWEADVVTQKDVLDITSRQEALNFEPGSRYMYSNTGFTLLAVVVERVTGKTLREFTKERIFDPLDMDNTHFHDDHQMIVENRTWAYEPDENGAFGLKNSIPDFDVVGATSLFTTAHDMAAWDRNFYTGMVGGETALERLHDTYVLSSGDTLSYAHGLSLGEYRGLKTVGHGGADAGYRSHFLRFPDQEFSVSVLCNVSTANPSSLARNVADIYLRDQFQKSAPDDSKKEEDQAVEMLASEELKELTGIYVAQPGDRIHRLQFKNDTLRLAAGPGFPLVQIDEKSFKVVGIGVRVKLVPSTDTSAAKLTLPFSNETYVRNEPWSPSDDELRSFAGTYYSPELGTTYEFVHKDSVLMFKHRKLDSQELKPTFQNGFELRGNSIVFTLDKRGNVDGFKISSGRSWNVRFDKSSK